jgi:chromate transport protein ChrA
MASHLTPEEKQQLELGKKLQQFYNLGYINKKQTILFTFYKGLASGFGAIIGGTIIVALLIWLLSQFGQVPLIGHFTNSVKQTINTHKSLKN